MPSKIFTTKAYLKKKIYLFIWPHWATAGSQFADQGSNPGHSSESVARVRKNFFAMLSKMLATFADTSILKCKHLHIPLPLKENFILNILLHGTVV